MNLSEVTTRDLLDELRARFEQLEPEEEPEAEIFRPTRRHIYTGVLVKVDPSINGVRFVTAETAQWRVPDNVYKRNYEALPEWYVGQQVRVLQVPGVSLRRAGVPYVGTVIELDNQGLPSQVTGAEEKDRWFVSVGDIEAI